MSRPYSRSSDQNKEAILAVFKSVVPQDKLRLFEIGSGMGQHAFFIAPHFPDLQWVTSDLAHRQAALRDSLHAGGRPNVHGPLVFEAGEDEFPTQKFDAVFASQVLHELSWKSAKTLFKALGNRLRKDALVLFYGAFKYGGEFRSERFAELDQQLKQRHPELGIRAFEDVHKAMTKAGFALLKDCDMPIENRLLVFKRLPHVKAAPANDKASGRSPGGRDR